MGPKERLSLPIIARPVPDPYLNKRPNEHEEYPGPEPRAEYQGNIVGKVLARRQMPHPVVAQKLLASNESNKQLEVRQPKYAKHNKSISNPSRM